jgi:hypothetical protein
VQAICAPSRRIKKLCFSLVQVIVQASGLLACHTLWRS